MGRPRTKNGEATQKRKKKVSQRSKGSKSSESTQKKKKKVSQRPKGAKKLKKKAQLLMRCSLAEFYKCAKLLKPRHTDRLRAAGFGPMLDGKVKTNIDRRLAYFLMEKIDPKTMILDLGVPNKVIQITAYAIHKLFGLPHGTKTAPRPSETGNDEDLFNLKKDLGYRRNEHINVDQLRKLLRSKVEDEDSDDLALQIFMLIMCMKVICPGTSVRVAREATWVKNLDLNEAKDMDICQLIVDEIKRAAINFQNADAKNKSLPGCAVAPLLIYLDCCLKSGLSDMDKRTPRTHYMDTKKLKKLAKLDRVHGGGDNQYGSLPVREF